jgi:GWxTD domain-containing protein
LNKIYIYILLFTILLPRSVSGFSVISDSSSISDFYLVGLNALESGDWKHALKTWEFGKTALDNREKSDPRLGIAYIELVTQRRLKEYYERATEIYLWGFSQRTNPHFYDVIAEEVNRILPLINPADHAQWKIPLIKEDPHICHKIRLFWIERDPLPFTRQNERLIEHWERIAYARENFVKNSLSVYNCDERGDIYIK